MIGYCQDGDCIIGDHFNYHTCPGTDIMKKFINDDSVTSINETCANELKVYDSSVA